MAATIDLSGQTILVTGGTGGIGSAICALFAKAGANTVASYFSHGDCAQAALEMRQNLAPQAKHQNFRADVSKSNDVESMTEFIRTGYGKLDFLVCAAGIGAMASVVETTDTFWNRVIATGLTSVFLTCRAMTPLLSNGGAIVTIGTGQLGRPQSGAYGAAKAGVESFTKTLAKELGPRCIRANVIAPGATDTSFGNGPKTDAFRNYIASLTALGRIAQADDIAGAVFLLCTDLGRFITGQVIKVDGGFDA